MANIEVETFHKILDLFNGEQKGNDRAIDLYKILGDFRGEIVREANNRILDVCKEEIEKLKRY